MCVCVCVIKRERERERERERVYMHVHLCPHTTAHIYLRFFFSFSLSLSLSLSLCVYKVYMNEYLYIHMFFQWHGLSLILRLYIYIYIYIYFAISTSLSHFLSIYNCYSKFLLIFRAHSISICSENDWAKTGDYFEKNWDCRLHFCRGVRPPTLCPRYDTKQSDGEVPVLLKLWRMWNTSLLPSLLGPLWPGVVAPHRPLSLG